LFVWGVMGGLGCVLFFLCVLGGVLAIVPEEKVRREDLEKGKEQGGGKEQHFRPPFGRKVPEEGRRGIDRGETRDTRKRKREDSTTTTEEGESIVNCLRTVLAHLSQKVSRRAEERKKEGVSWGGKNPGMRIR